MVQQYVWNWMTFSMAIDTLYWCWFVGIWGLVFDNDDGAMINTCVRINGGTSVPFILQYQVLIKNEDAE